MRNKIRLTILSIWMLTISSTAIEPYRGSRLFWDSANPIEVFSGGGYCRIIELQDGRLMACCESGGIKISFSSNKGKAWSTPRKIVENVNNIPNCVPDLIQLTNGTIIVAYNPRPKAPYTEDRLFGIRCKRSEDNGETWSDEIWIYDASYIFSDGCWEPSMLELPSGEVQLYFADEGPYTSTNEQQISMCRSFDKGKTWSAAQKVCYRKGYRDGMPVPVLLQDNSYIVVAIEDNGCGYGDFIPSTVRCPLETNWNNYWVNAYSENRLIAPDYNYCPVAKGGAPYIRRSTTGEMVMSHQSKLNNGEFRTMYAYVGDKEGKNFKSMSRPFILLNNQEALWNSLCVLNDGTVLAVAGINGAIKMVKGETKTTFMANFSTPSVDGRALSNDHYYTTGHNQVLMGGTLGHSVALDFAYDNDSLYLFCRADDKTQILEGAEIDGLRLYIESAGMSNLKPLPTSYCYDFRLNGSYDCYVGNNEGTWSAHSNGKAYMVIRKVKNSYYIMEIAIPWSALELQGPPIVDMRVNVCLYDASAEGLKTESIPDATSDGTWTWMPLHLIVPTSIRNVPVNESVNITCTQKQLEINSSEELADVVVYSLTGSCLARHNSPCKHVRMSLSALDPVIVRLQFLSGKILSRTISPK